METQLCLLQRENEDLQRRLLGSQQNFDNEFQLAERRLTELQQQCDEFVIELAQARKELHDFRQQEERYMEQIEQSETERQLLERSMSDLRAAHANLKRERDISIEQEATLKENLRQRERDVHTAEKQAQRLEAEMQRLSADHDVLLVQLANFTTIKREAAELSDENEFLKLELQAMADLHSSPAALLVSGSGRAVLDGPSRTLEDELKSSPTHTDSTNEVRVAALEREIVCSLLSGRLGACLTRYILENLTRPVGHC